MNWGVVAILASGPSMTQEVADTVRAAGIAAIVINNTWRRMPDAAALMASDSRWWAKRNPQLSPSAEEFAGERFCCQEQTKGAVLVKPTSQREGGNGALHAAKDVAAPRGARLILLCGVDLRDDQLTHWHGLHNGLNNPTAPGFSRARAAWKRYAAMQERPRIINCSADSALMCFERMPLEQALAQ